VPEKCTALAIKRLAGHDTTSWLYVRLPRHKYDEKCDCYSCEHSKWWKRPAWVRRSEFRATWHRWIRYDIGARNIRLTTHEGDHFLIVAEVDMPDWAGLMVEKGTHGQLIALPWYRRKRAA
jgi:hypothetical protein